MATEIVGAASAVLSRLLEREEHAERRLCDVDAAGERAVRGEPFREVPHRLRPAIPEQRMPAGLEQPHHAVADQEQGDAIEEPPGHWICFHKIKRAGRDAATLPGEPPPGDRESSARPRSP